MKFTLSLVILAAAASQAMAVVPTPIASCTKTVVVQATDNDGCAAFAARNSVTFENLKKWNQRLRDDCLNLDLGEKICVSVTPGAGDVSVAGGNGAAPISTGTGTTAAPAPGPTPTPSLGGGAPSAHSTTSPSNNNNKSPAATGAAASTPTTNANGAAAGLSGKTSLVLGAASALLSFVYIL